jgi:Cu/Ag efflux protein CusF
MTGRHRLVWLFALISVLAVAVFPGCKAKQPLPPVREYRIDGEILKTNPGDQTATIKHQEIKGWMGAMTMDYPIRSRDDFQKLHAGDRITGKVYVQGEDFSVGEITVTPKETPAAPKP